LRIFKIILAIYLLPFSIAVAQSDGFQTPPWLEFVEEIRIPNDQHSGVTSGISIDRAGNVHFNAGSSPYLFSRRLNQLIKLNPEGCRPGVDPSLPNSWFTPDGEIVANFGTSYFWFNLSGKCVHYVIDKNLAAGQMAALPGRNLVFIRNYTNPYTMERMDASGSVTLSAEIDKLPIANIASRTIGGGVIFSNGRYYWANSRTSTVASFDTQFNLEWKKVMGLEDLPFFLKDLTDQESRDYTSHMPRVLREGITKASIVALSTVDRNTLILYAHYNKKAYFQLFDHNGNLLERYESDGAFRHNPNSRLFFRSVNDDELVLYVYRMK